MVPEARQSVQQVTDTSNHILTPEQEDDTTLTNARGVQGPCRSCRASRKLVVPYLPDPIFAFYVCDNSRANADHWTFFVVPTIRYACFNTYPVGQWQIFFVTPPCSLRVMYNDSTVIIGQASNKAILTAVVAKVDMFFELPTRMAQCTVRVGDRHES